jgi:hypothetical protein
MRNKKQQPGFLGKFIASSKPFPLAFGDSEKQFSKFSSTCVSVLAFSSRVRKIPPTDIYERSQFFGFAGRVPIDRGCDLANR